MRPRGIKTAVVVYKKFGCTSSIRFHNSTSAPPQQPAPAQKARTPRKLPKIDEIPNETEAQSSKVASDHAKLQKVAETTPATTKDEKNPFRHALAWTDPKFYDEKDLDHELRRVFDVCHGCRRCFNLCNSFPSLFDLIDKSPSGELDTVDSKNFKGVVDECTLCDMCFLTKCPYTPPHSFNIDFPHLMLRYRAVENKDKNAKHITSQPEVTVAKTTGFLDEKVSAKVHVKEGTSTTLEFEKTDFMSKELTKTDRNGKLGTLLSPVANYAMKNKTARKALEKVADVDKKADIPEYASKTLLKLDAQNPVKINENRKTDRKVVLFATCLGNYNNPNLGIAAREVLAKNGVEVKIDYTQCCSMPQLEQGDLDAVSKAAKSISEYFVQNYVDKGYKVITLVASCSLMLKQEWPLILPNDANVKRLSENTKDISEYVVDISKNEGLVKEGLGSVPYSVSLHHACHARAQNHGNKGLELLKNIPSIKVKVVEKCSGHGGSWGVKKEHYETALKVGAPVIKQVFNDVVKGQKAAPQEAVVVSSECPLASSHIAHGAEHMADDKDEKSFNTPRNKHPIEVLAEAYGIWQV